MTQPADLDWDADGRPRSRFFDDVYFSLNDGLAESRQVFLQANQLPARFAALAPGEAFSIGETGFGSGLNFLATWQLWCKLAPATAQLHFVSVEKFPLRRDDLARVHQAWPELATWVEVLLAHYPPVAASGFHRLQLAANVVLTLIFDDALGGFSQCLAQRHAGPLLSQRQTGWCAPARGLGQLIDAWFLDGFAPAKNPEMWQPALFPLLARLSRSNASFATFTAAGAVRRGLQAAGFKVRKVPGYGQKREMLCGELTSASTQPAPATAPDPSWHLVADDPCEVREVAVIGAGLAGAHTARALAERGLQVSVFDSGAIAGGASGNPVGVLYKKFSPGEGELAAFNLAAFVYACRHYQQRGLFARCGEACGVLQLPGSAQDLQRFSEIARQYAHSPELVRHVSAEQASAIAGIALHSSALWMPTAGFLRPRELCRTLLDHRNIRLFADSAVTRLDYRNQRWHLYGNALTPLATSDAVVVASAQHSRQFPQCQALPTRAIRGQISFVEATPSSSALRSVLCGEGYMTPAEHGRHCAGATFELHNTGTSLSTQGHEDNLQRARALAEPLQNLPTPALAAGRVSFRCTSPDYLPIVGPAPQAQAMRERFAAYRHNAKALIDQPGCYWPRLLVNTGHGSKGLSSTPICGELIATMLTGELAPLPRTLVQRLHPARFLIRNLIRRR